jgi:hypothetical protein
MPRKRWRTAQTRPPARQCLTTWSCLLLSSTLALAEAPASAGGCLGPGRKQGALRWCCCWCWGTVAAAHVLHTKACDACAVLHVLQ